MTNSIVRVYKEISAVPTPYVANATYYIRVGAGIDIYVANSTGTAVHKHNVELNLAEYSNVNLASPVSDSLYINKKSTNTGEIRLFILGFPVFTNKNEFYLEANTSEGVKRTSLKT